MGLIATIETGLVTGVGTMAYAAGHHTKQMRIQGVLRLILIWENGMISNVLKVYMYYYPKYIREIAPP